MIDSNLLRESCLAALKKLSPANMVKNPVMFVVFVGSLFSTLVVGLEIVSTNHHAVSFNMQLTVWLWFTVLFANFAEAMAEGRGKAQADSLRRSRSETTARRLKSTADRTDFELIPSTDLRKNDLILVEAGQVIPADGEIVKGVASVDESAVTGESAPVIREAGGDRSAVTGGTTVLSDWLIIRVQSDPGEGFVDRMIRLIEGAKRQKTPNEIALTILLAGFTIIFLFVCATLYPFAQQAGAGVTPMILVALLVCLIPTTIGGLLSAIGIAGMDRLVQRNVIAVSGRAVEAAGDVDVLLLDKTGTITHGNRQASEFRPGPKIEAARLASAARLSSLADETPEGKSIVVLADKLLSSAWSEEEDDLIFVPFSAETRMSGVNLPNGRAIRKGAQDAILRYLQENGVEVSPSLVSISETIARQGGTPLWVAENDQALGVVYLKDVVKPGIKARFAQLREMGIKTVMVTGDNPLTAAAIAAEAGVDDFLAEATPEAKLSLIRDHQAQGRLVAMTGDGTNDAPALAQADVAVAMQSGTQPAREAANMVDLDSNPTKLIEIVEVGKQLLMTRGALTTFSIANDVAKYFAIIPAAFAGVYPALETLDFMNLSTPQSAILSAVIFNALIIVALIPLALRGVAYKPQPAEQILRNNLLVYGVGGVIAPFIGIKIIDLALTAGGLV